MSKDSGISRSDRRRNARRERLRGLLPLDGAVLGSDLGDAKQALALVDHDMRVLWRRSPRCAAHQLGGPIAEAARAGTPRLTAELADHRLGLFGPLRAEQVAVVLADLVEAEEVAGRGFPATRFRRRPVTWAGWPPPMPRTVWSRRGGRSRGFGAPPGRAAKVGSGRPDPALGVVRNSMAVSSA